MTAPVITALPTVPSSVPTFSNDADAYLAAIPTLIDESNEVAGYRDIHDPIVELTGLAGASAGDNDEWVSGSTYAYGDVAWSPIDYQDYVRIVAGAGTTDPSADPVNWQPCPGTGDATLTGAESFSGKTLVNPVFRGAPIEQVYAIVDGASVDIDPANGTIQTWVLTDDRTPTADNFAEGQEIALFVQNPLAATVTWPSVTWINEIEPSYVVGKYTAIVLSKVGGALEGKFVGNVASPFHPLNLFANGEQGAWYDPSDAPTLLKGDAGGGGIASVNDTVSIMLDKSKGLSIGAEVITNGGLSSGTGWAYGANVSFAADGATFAAFDALTQTTGGFVAGQTYIVEFDYTALTSTPGFALRLGQTATNDYIVTTQASGHVKLYIRAGGTGTAFQFRYNNTGTFRVANISVKHIAGNHAYQGTLANRPILRQDGSRYYLEFDGTDDWLATSAIDFTGTDAVTMFAGQRKQSGTFGALAELSVTSNSNDGTFYIFAPGATSTYAVRSRGTVIADAQSAASYAQPHTAVLTMQGDISDDFLSLRLNGASVATSAGNQGTGNFGNYPLYIGRRAGTSLPFTGRLYGLIIRGAATDAALINRTEALMNVKTGAY